jgi:hypothetical protein
VIHPPVIARITQARTCVELTKFIPSALGARRVS